MSAVRVNDVRIESRFSNQGETFGTLGTVELWKVSSWQHF